MNEYLMIVVVLLNNIETNEKTPAIGCVSAVDEHGNEPTLMWCVTHEGVKVPVVECGDQDAKHEWHSVLPHQKLDVNPDWLAHVQQFFSRQPTTV